MKRIISFLTTVIVTVPGMSVFADFLKDDVLEIKDAVEIIKNDEEVDWSVVDEENIFEFKLVELGKSYGATVTEYWFFLPTVDGHYFLSDFHGHENEYNGTITDERADSFVQRHRVCKEYSVEQAKKYAKANGLSEPERINCYMFSHMGCPIYGYDVVCDGEEYIIMFFMPDYPNVKNQAAQYNYLDNDDCALEIGKAYTPEEFKERYYLEQSYYSKYIDEKNAEEEKNSHYIYKNDDLEDVEHFPENEKKEDVKEDKKEEVIEKEEKEEKKEENEKTDEKTEEKSEEKEEQKSKEENDVKKEEQVFKKTSFADVPESHWAYGDITELTGYGIILGYGNGYFGVDDSVTYEQLGLLLNRQFDYTSRYSGEKAAKRKDVFCEIARAAGAEIAEVDASVLNSFSDIEGLTETEKKYISYAVQNKLVFGFDGKLCPHDSVTRAETAALLRRAMNFCNEK